MFTDLVGYSSITSLDEGRALKLLEEHRALLQPVFGRHGGTVVKTMGDGFLVEFASAVEAVNCAVKAQEEIRKLNAERRPDDRILARIGIHVGDIFHSQGDILGDAVNVAARLQTMAPPGGICLTRQVVDQIERRVPYKFVRLGVRDLKNIQHPVELYKLEVNARLSESEEPTLDPRRIAILPLANLSPDPNDRYFADGMTEELISTVSRIKELSVISRTSVMRYRDTTTPVGDIGRELSVGTLLEGSVRKAGNKVRITTQLIDAKSDKHLWVQSYDRDLTDIFTVQGDIAERVAEALKVKLRARQKETIGKKQTSNPESYMLYLKGRYLWNERTQEAVTKALRYFEEAVRSDPDFALAYSGMSDCYSIRSDRGWASYTEAGPLAKTYAEKALTLDSELAEAHASLGLALNDQWDMAGAAREFKQAIALKPNYAMAYHWYSNLLLDLGKYEEALEYEKHALELDPYSSIFSQEIGISLLYLGKTREAKAQFEKLAEMDPSFSSLHTWKAWAYEREGDLDQAIKEARKAVEMSAVSVYKLNLATLCARAGRKEEAARLIEEARSDPSGGYKSPAFIAMAKLDLGEEDEGFDWLERAYEEHDKFLLYFKEFPWFAKYRADKRWLDIERRMGAPKN